MSLPTPNLDDRTFQDLVDDAKRHVQSVFPDWTDHNVSDPGVTLIEAVAVMVDQLVYRLNRVPDRHYVKFLELLGVRLRPPSPARGVVTFWLSAAQAVPVLVRTGTQVATDRTGVDDPLVFTTTRELAIAPCRLVRLGTVTAAGEVQDRTPDLELALRGRPDGGPRETGSASRTTIPVFTDAPVPGDALLLGLSAPVPHCAVRLRFDGPVGGTGIDPRRPPLAWEAWTSSGWAPCDVDHDDTGGFNRTGDVLLHVPAGHQESALAGGRAAWLRCRLTDLQPGYEVTPWLSTAMAETIGGTTTIAHLQEVTEEILGIATGAAAARFRLARPPVVDVEATVIEVVPRDGQPQVWQLVDRFGGSGAQDRHVQVDPATGQVEFGPLVRGGDGQAQQYGAVPPVGATVVARRYLTGGGRRGNVGTGLIRVLKSSVPYVHAVENRGPTTGGSNGETTQEAMIRGPFQVRSGSRAITAEDYETLARAAVPDLARVRCLPASESMLGVRVLILPFVPCDAMGRIAYRDLAQPPAQVCTAVAEHLDRHRPVGARVLVTPPELVGVSVVARVTGTDGADLRAVESAALRAINDYLSPFDGGPDLQGWPFGRPVNGYEISGLLAAIPGVHLVEETLLFPDDPRLPHNDPRARGNASQRITIPADALPYSYRPRIRVESAG